jgi:hypothetical protein
MQDNPQNLLANLGEDEKSTPVMAYSANGLAWGHLITKGAMLPERILTGVTVPDFITLHDAQTIVATGTTLSKPEKYSELHFPYDEIIGFHLMPPQEAQLDYDPSEPNRIMTPVTVQVGAFHFHANYRISTQTSIQTMLDVTKSDFIPIYDVDISHPGNPNMKAIHVNLALVRRRSTFFGISN